MMMVFSLPTSMRLAWPRSAKVTFSSVMPISSAIDFAAGENRDVFEHGFATIAKAWSLDSHNFQECREWC